MLVRFELYTLMSLFYPMEITESRYSGMYSGGAYILVSGLPTSQTDACGGNIPCMKFWERVEEDGPVLEVENPLYSEGDENRFSETTEIFVTSGPHPTAVFEEFTKFERDWKQKQDNQVINDLIFEYPDLYIKGNEDGEARNKLAALASARTDSLRERGKNRVANRLLSERYNVETQEFTSLDDESKKNVRQFVRENSESIPAIRYRDPEIF